jgi:hypothetical protein
MGTHQLENQVESMDYEYSGPVIRSPVVQAIVLRIREFPQQRLQIDEQSTRLWCRTDEHGNLCDTLIVKPDINEVDTILIHIKDLTNPAPCQILYQEKII